MRKKHWPVMRSVTMRTGAPGLRRAAGPSRPRHNPFCGASPPPPMAGGCLWRVRSAVRTRRNNSIWSRHGGTGELLLAWLHLMASLLRIYLVLFPSLFISSIFPLPSYCSSRVPARINVSWGLSTEMLLHHEALCGQMREMISLRRHLCLRSLPASESGNSTPALISYERQFHRVRFCRKTPTCFAVDRRDWSLNWMCIRHGLRCF